MLEERLAEQDLSMNAQLGDKKLRCLRGFYV